MIALGEAKGSDYYLTLPRPFAPLSVTGEVVLLSESRNLGGIYLKESSCHEKLRKSLERQERFWRDISSSPQACTRLSIGRSSGC